MAPTGLAILLGAGPVAGAGIARVLADPSRGNMAVALLARRPESLKELVSSLRKSAGEGAVIEAFQTDAASEESVRKAFKDIQEHKSFANLKAKVAIFSVKHSSKKPFMSETYKDFTESLETYVGGAFVFAQEALALFFKHNGETTLSEGGGKKGTLIFSGTLGALRCSAEFAAYGAGRASVRQLAQTIAREMSPKGVHVVHSILNGGVVDAHEDEDVKATSEGKKMHAEAVGSAYLWLSQQEPTLWTHELDFRPAQEKF